MFTALHCNELGVMHHWLMGMASEEGQHVYKFYAFTKQLMGGAPRTYACIQINELEMPFTTKVGS